MLKYNITFYSKVTLYASAFMMFILMLPWFVWFSPWQNIALLIILILNFRAFSFDKKKIPYILFLSVIILCYQFYEIDLNSIVKCILLILFFNIRTERYIYLFYYFKKTLALFLIPSIILYILVTFFDVSFYSSVIGLDQSVRDYSYTNYIFFIDGDYPTLFKRFCSYFEEPGVLGTIGGMILVSDKYDLKDKYNIIIFLGCLLTFSFYFYLLSMIYVLLFNNGKNRYFLLILLFLFVFILTSSEYFEPLVNRFSFENNKFVGDNRVGADFEVWYNNFIKSPDLWFGYGVGKVHAMFPEGSSYKYLIAEYGLILFILYCISFFMLAFNLLSNKKDLFIWCTIFFSCLYQRPLITHYIYPIIWFISIFIIQNSNSLFIKKIKY